MSQFHSVPLSTVWFDDAVRQRQSLGDVTSLAESIARVGQLNPIIIERDGRLVAGRRRFAAVSSLGWTHITAQYRDELDEQTRQLIEYAENADRLDLSWQETSIAIYKFHELSYQLDKSWTQDKSAERFGIDPSYLRRHIRVAEALLRGDKLVTEAPQFSTAIGIIERQEARRRDSEIASIDKWLNDGEAPAEETAPSGELLIAKAPEPPPPPILNADFIKWAQSYSGPRFNFLHCDFPYGIEADNHDQGAAKSFGGYADSEEVYWKLIDYLIIAGTASPQLIADSAHMLFWFSMKFYERTKIALEAGGWKVNPTPLIWHRSDNSGILPDPRRMPRQVYETALLCSRGDRFLVRPKSNLFASPNSKQWHMSEKPLPVLSYFLEMLVDDTTIALDPTCGSANSLIAARRLGARHVQGLEINPDFHSLAVQNWRKEFPNDE